MPERYEFLGSLGSGGFGKISLYYDHQAQKKVVQKALLDPTPDNCRRLIREGKMYMRLRDNQHIADLLAHRFDYTDPCLLLPFYEDGTLQKHVGSGNWYDSIIYIQHGAVGLQGVHALGGIHRDIKPPNMFVDRNEQGQKLIKLGDFGFGRLPQPFTSGDITRHACGTPDYIAPELYLPNPEFTPECDIYSLGITGIELITGSRNRESIKNIWINGDVTKLLLAMTSWIPSQRPDAQTVASTITSIVKTYDENFKTGVKVAALGLLGVLLYKGASKS